MYKQKKPTSLGLVEASLSSLCPFFFKSPVDNKQTNIYLIHIIFFNYYYYFRLNTVNVLGVFENLKKYSHYIQVHTPAQQQWFYAKINFREKRNNPRPPNTILFVLLYRCLQFIVIGPAESGDNVFIFNKNERWHRHDVVFHRNILTLIHIHLTTCNR